MPNETLEALQPKAYDSALMAYVRETILEAVENYAEPGREVTQVDLADCFMDAMRGTDTGWWHDLIYTAPMLGMAHEYAVDIRTVIREFLAETGAAQGDPCTCGGDMTWADALVATTAPRTFADYSGDDDNAKLEADAKLFGLRFAVDYLTSELASEVCPDL